MQRFVQEHSLVAANLEKINLTVDAEIVFHGSAKRTVPSFTLHPSRHSGNSSPFGDMGCLRIHGIRRAKDTHNAGGKCQTQAQLGAQSGGDRRTVFVDTAANREQSNQNGQDAKELVLQPAKAFREENCRRAIILL